MSLLSRIVLVRFGTIRTANIGVGVVEVGLWCAILRLRIDVGSVGWSW